ncbi:MAG: exodeoxyribonuclease VII large subunit [Robiginitomaculum sp.]|nr:exodeoxyribonuclease VII large subunit [Robiginitomaculum sp.]
MNNTPTNAHEYSVSELAFSLKRTVEQTFGRVRVRGELGRVVIAKSGHMYVDVKDDKAVIASIMWKGSVSRLPVRPEEGMEVIVEGKLTTYPGRSQYQLVIDRLEPAGVGALMAMLEKRKKMLAAEGLFGEEHKQELPYLPRTIGVITSPTGAVIRDILHRVEDRFPLRVLVWPVLVQGDAAAAQISAAITGFNHYDETDELPRPDVLIVARGGGSIEDLWCFNEENVVRAAFASDIPIISAVGHETDWTLIDYVADERAPTPTGAAEIAVPVRAELIDTVDDYGLRLKRGLSRTVESKKLSFAAAKLPRLDTVLSNPRQRFDLAAARLRPDALVRDIARKNDSVQNAGREAVLSMGRLLQKSRDRLAGAGKLLEAYSYQGVLERGYALVTDTDGKVVRKGKRLKVGQAVNLTFSDGKRGAVIDGTPKPKRHIQKPVPPTEKIQGDLF